MFLIDLVPPLPMSLSLSRSNHNLPLQCCHHVCMILHIYLSIYVHFCRHAAMQSYCIHSSRFKPCPYFQKYYAHRSTAVVVKRFTTIWLHLLCSPGQLHPASPSRSCQNNLAAPTFIPHSSQLHQFYRLINVLIIVVPTTLWPMSDPFRGQSLPVFIKLVIYFYSVRSPVQIPDIWTKLW